MKLYHSVIFSDDLLIFSVLVSSRIVFLKSLCEVLKVNIYLDSGSVRAADKDGCIVVTSATWLIVREVSI